ncbi:MAG: sensor histidine kinase [Thermoanaerobaculaceae bacterium]
MSAVEQRGRTVLGTSRWETAAWLVGGVTVIGLLNLSIALTSELASRSRVPAAKVVVWEMTGAYTALLVLPLLLLAMRRLPIERRNLAPRLATFCGLFAAASVVHTLAMWGSRTVVYRLLGWGAYDYGDMRFRFLMEGGKHLLFYSGLLALVTALGYARRSRVGELAASRLAAELTEARLEALKMQLNPHFLFNTLNMISSHVHSDPDTADAMIGHLSDFLRETLRHSKAQEVPLERELDFLGAYLAITKARFEERLQVELDVAEGCGQALVPHLVLQPLVENAVTHCMADPTRAGRVRVRAHTERRSAGR